MTRELADWLKALAIPYSNDRRWRASEQVAFGRGCVAGKRSGREIVSLRAPAPAARDADVPSEMTSSEALTVCRSSGRSSARFVLECLSEMEAGRGGRRRAYPRGERQDRGLKKEELDQHRAELNLNRPVRGGTDRSAVRPEQATPCGRSDGGGADQLGVSRKIASIHRS